MIPEVDAAKQRSKDLNTVQPGRIQLNQQSHSSSDLATSAYWESVSQLTTRSTMLLQGMGAECITLNLIDITGYICTSD